MESKFSVELCAVESINLDPLLFKVGTEDFTDILDPIVLQAGKKL